MLLDSYVVLHAAFVSALHKLVGIEFAAYFVQSVVSSYERYFAQLQELDSTPADSSETQDPDRLNEEKETRGKECSNLIVLLSELYNFQVIACVLVYDIIRGLLEGALSEVKVELLLKIARSESCRYGPVMKLTYIYIDRLWPAATYRRSLSAQGHHPNCT